MLQVQLQIRMKFAVLMLLLKVIMAPNQQHLGAPLFFNFFVFRCVWGLRGNLYIREISDIMVLYLDMGLQKSIFI